MDFSFSYKSDELNLDIENIFEFCYELDENEIPARYRLKQLDRVFQNFTDKVNI